MSSKRLLEDETSLETVSSQHNKKISYDCPVLEIVSLFEQNKSTQAWTGYLKLSSWIDREEVSSSLSSKPDALQRFLDCYKLEMQPYFRDDFYQILENDMTNIANEYADKGSIDIQLLKLECLDSIAHHSISLESKGNRRYATTRTVYPPGEVKQWDDDDPRKQLLSEANLVAVGSSKMECEDAVQWIYHSPHLKLFVQRAMKFVSIYPYQSDLGVAVNIMKKSPNDHAKTSLGFHFDTIDSSVGNTKSENRNTRGATGVIGIQDCLVGGERISFPGVCRENVSAVKKVVDNFDPLNPFNTFTLDGPESVIVPTVVTEPISGVLSLFDGGDILHGVSSVRSGVRVATVFLYCETDPVESQSTLDSANAFYNIQSDN